MNWHLNRNGEPTTAEGPHLEGCTVLSIRAGCAIAGGCICRRMVLERQALELMKRGVIIVDVAFEQALREAIGLTQ